MAQNIGKDEMKKLVIGGTYYIKSGGCFYRDENNEVVCAFTDVEEVILEDKQNGMDGGSDKYWYKDKRCSSCRRPHEDPRLLLDQAKLHIINREKDLLKKAKQTKNLLENIEDKKRRMIL